MAQTSVKTLPGPRRGSAGHRDTRWAIAISIGLFASVLVAFGQTLRQGFLNFDDSIFTFDEPHVSGGFSWSAVAWAFSKGGPAGEWCPLTMLSHMLDCQLYGLAPAGHHLTNVLLHALAAVALFLVLWRMTSQRAVPEVAQASGGRVAQAGPSAITLWPSALVAALFALHPQRVESVAWIAERRDVLSGLFFMLTLGAYDEFSRHPRSLWRYLLVAVLLALGLMSKAMLMSVPALLLLLDFWPLGRFRGTALPATGASERPVQSAWRLIAEKLPLAAMAVASAAQAIVSHTGSNSNPILTFPERLANAAVSCVAYIGQMFVPVGLSFFYPYPPTGVPPAWQVAAASVLLLAITAAAVIWRRACPYLFVGWFWYVGMLLPVLELITVGGHARADRYTYLPQIGLDVAVAWGAMRLVASWPARRWVLGTAAAAVLIAMVAATWRQTGFWRDSQTLWEHALACDQDNPMADFNLGAVLDSEKQDEAGAIAHYRRAIQLDSGQRDVYFGARMRAYYGLGVIAARKGNFDQAVADYRQALAIGPDFVLVLVNLGVVLTNQQKLAEAKDCFQQARQAWPEGVDPVCGLGVVSMMEGQTDEAIDRFREALQLDPDSTLALTNLATLLAGRDDAEAIGYLRRLIQLDPDQPEHYRYLAALLRQQGNSAEADRYDQLGTAASRRRAMALNRQGTELVRQGKFGEAVAQFQAAIAADPDNALAHCNLAEALAAAGKLQQASAEYRRALQIDPNLARARQGLERLPH